MCPTTPTCPLSQYSLTPVGYFGHFTGIYVNYFYFFIFFSQKWSLHLDSSFHKMMWVPNLRSPPLSFDFTFHIFTVLSLSHLHYNLKPHYLLFYLSFDSNRGKCTMYKYFSQFRIMIKWLPKMTFLSLKIFLKCSSMFIVTWLFFHQAIFSFFYFFSYTSFLLTPLVSGILCLHRSFCWSLPSFTPVENNWPLCAEANHLRCATYHSHEWELLILKSQSFFCLVSSYWRTTSIHVIRISAWRVNGVTPWRFPTIRHLEILCSAHFGWGVKVSEPFHENTWVKLFTIYNHPLLLGDIELQPVCPSSPVLRGPHFLCGDFYDLFFTLVVQKVHKAGCTAVLF